MLFIKVYYLLFNYKDVLLVIGNLGVSRNFFYILGIDVVGMVVLCGDNCFKEGDEVIVIGFDFGMNIVGGFGEYIRILSEWVVVKLNGFMLRELMIIGIVGFIVGLLV